jgi:enoyl-CoA hydratase/carnithine racemase
MTCSLNNELPIKPAAPAAGDAIVLDRRSGDLAIITLNRPRVMNALSLDMVSRLGDTAARIAADSSVRAVIIRANGPGFCAGHDLREITAHRGDHDAGRGYYEELFGSCAKLMMSLRNLTVPVIAEIHGIATATGCQLVANCDLAVTSSEARFGVNGIDSGLFCSTPMVALSRNIPPKAALEMLMLGDIISADRALQLGLVNQIVAPAQLSATVMQLAERIAAKPKAVIALGKKAFYEQLEMPLEVAYDHTVKVIVDNMMLREAQIGIDAFLKKSQPH